MIAVTDWMYKLAGRAFLFIYSLLQIISSSTPLTASSNSASASQNLPYYLLFNHHNH